jgi:hypothetical protein
LNDVKEAERHEHLARLHHQDIDVSKALKDKFNFPKIRLKFHWVEQIRLHGALQQYSSLSHEQAHQMNLKDGWSASKHNLNNLPHVIIFQHHILCIEISELTLQALELHEVNSTAVCTVLPSSADLAALQRSQSYAQP